MDPLVIAVLAAVVWGGAMALLGRHALRRARAEAAAKVLQAEMRAAGRSSGDIVILQGGTVKGETHAWAELTVTELSLDLSKAPWWFLFENVVAHGTSASTVVSPPPTPQQAAAAGDVSPLAWPVRTASA